MDKFSTFFGLKLSHLIFSGTERMSLTFQGKETTIQEGIMPAELAIQYLERQRSDNAFFSFPLKMLKTPKTSLHCLPCLHTDSLRGGLMSLDSSTSYLSRQYYDVLDLLIGELRRRFQQKRGIPVVAVLE